MHSSGEIINERFRIDETLKTGHVSSLFKAFDMLDKRSIALKLFFFDSSPAADIIRFHTEQDLLKEIDHPSIVKIYEHGSCRGSGESEQFVAMEYTSGPNLEEFLNSGEDLSLEMIVAGAIELCGALETVHNRGIIHGDLKPENIILTEVEEKNNVLKLVDFGSARLKTFHEAEIDDYISGTFACMAPEQCGLVYAPVEEASDLYAMGVLLYRLCTGMYPFEGRSLSELLHHKISRMPPKPSRLKAEIPPVLDSLIMRLLAPEPSDRYRDAHGLGRDLERFAAGERNFFPGEKIPIGICATVPFTGRENELAEIENIYNNIREGEACFHVITGEAGIGKTRFLRELRKKLLARSACVLEGRALERENREPWSLFRGTMHEYLKIFQQYDREKKNRVVHYLRQECGDFSSIITTLIPGMELLFGVGPSMTALEPEREGKRFHLSLVRFLRALVTVEESMVVLLDDLHWADEGSIRLLEEAMKSLGDRSLLMILAMRGEEKGTDGLVKLFSRLKADHGVVIGSLTLSPLTLPDLKRYIGLVLGGGKIEKDVLSEYLLSQGGGNPLFTEELLRGIINRKILIQDDGRWLVDIDKLNRAKLPEDTLGVISERIENLSKDVTIILSHAAIIGRNFSVDILISIFPLSEEPLEQIRRVMLAMAHASREGLVMEDVAERGMVIFTHDRVREAFYRRIKARERKQLHGRIVEAIEKKHGSDRDRYIFDLAHHAIESGIGKKIIFYSRIAGLKAMENHAYEEAVRFLGAVRQALEDEGSCICENEEKKIWLEVMEKYGESLVFLGRSDEGIEVFEELIKKKMNEEKLGNYYQFLTLAYFRKGDFRGCEKYSSEALNLYGEKVPLKRINIVLSTVKELFIHFLWHGFPGSDIFRRKGNSENTKRIIMNYKWLLYAYYWWDGRKALRTVLRTGNLAERFLDSSTELAESYYNYGMFYVVAGIFKKADEFYQRSLTIHRENNNNFGVAQTFNGLGLMHLIKGEFRKCIEICNRSISIFETSGDYIELSKFTQFSFVSYYMLGEYKSAMEIYQRYFLINTNLIDEMMYSGCYYPVREFIDKGKYKEALEVLNRYLEAQKEMKLWYLYGLSLVSLGRLHNEQGKFLKSREVFEYCFTVCKKEMLPMHFINSLYPFYCETLINQHTSDFEFHGRWSRFKSLRRIKKYTKKSLRKTRRFNHHYDVALRGAAKYYLLENNFRKAERYFSAAIEKSEAMGKRYEEARTRYEYGCWLLEQREYNRAWAQLDRSYMIFKEIDIVHYQKKILDLMQHEGERRSPLRRFLDRERKDRVIACVDEINGCSSYEDLIDTVLQRSMEISGARGGAFFLADPGANYLHLEITHNANDEPFEYSHHIVDKCFAERRIIITTSAEESEEFSPYRSVSAAGLKSIICLPLARNDLLVGVCYMDNSLARGVFTRDDARLLKFFFSSAAVNIENALLTKKIHDIEKEECHGGETSVDEYCGKTISFIEEHFQEDLSREEIARDVGVSPDYLGKLVKAHTGKSLREHINEARIRWALEQLENSNMQIIDIAYDAGFESLRTFNRTFVRIMGDSPKKYRE